MSIGSGWGLWSSKSKDEYRRMREAVLAAEAAKRMATPPPSNMPAPFTTAVSSSGYVNTFPSFTIEEPPPKPALEDRGLAIEPIVGLREFGLYMDGNDPVLVSFNGTPWPAYEALYASCGNNPLSAHDAPDRECQCGIYAWREDHDHPRGVGSITGEVYLWGDVLICDYGYRAEVSYPKSLHIENPATRSAMRVRDGLADMYGVTVTLGQDEPSPAEPF